MSMWEPFTEHARRCVVLAQEEAKRLGSNYIGTEHILLGIISEGENLAAKALATLGVDLAKARAEADFLVGRGGQNVHQDMMVFTPRAKRIIELAFEEARQLNHNYIASEHLLLGLVREGEGTAARILTNLGVESGRLRVTILEHLGTAPAQETPGAFRVGPTPGRTTIAATHAILAGKEAAMRLGMRMYDCEHLLYGIAHCEDSPASQILAEHGVRAQTLRQYLGNMASDLELNEREIEPSAAVGLCYEGALANLPSMSRLMLGPEMLLFTLTDGTEHRALEILKALGADIELIRAKLKERLYGRNA